MQALVAKVAKKAWLWPCLPGLTMPHFPGKPGQKPGKPGLASLFQAARVFGRAPDARESACVTFQSAISGVCRFHSSFMVSFAFCSPFSIHSVCRLQVVFMACVAFQFPISGVFRFYSSFMVSLVFCSPFSVHSVCRLQVVFIACTTFKLFS